MHRQSLGSPGSNNQHHSIQSSEDDSAEKKRRRSSRPGSEETQLPEKISNDDDHSKLDKPIKSVSDHRSIHLIPLLTFLCFLVLYLCSHDPSPKDLVGFGGFGSAIDSQETDMVRSEAAVTRGNRHLNEVEKIRLGGGGRKLGGGRRRR